MKTNSLRLAILFDVDGTLINSLADIAGVTNLMRREWGLSSLSEEAVRPHIGRGATDLVRGCFTEILSDRASVEKLVDQYRAYYLKTPHFGGSAYPGVAETLIHFRKHTQISLGVVTNKPTRTAEVTLRYYLPQCSFDIIAGPEKVSERKPSPAHLLEVIDELGVNKENAYFVGDDPVDLECATRAGVIFFGATYGFGGVKISGFNRLERFSDLKEKITLDETNGYKG